MTKPHPRISKGIIDAFSKVWQKPELKNFNVTVDGEKFSCHSFILASSSEFFAGLLRSNMKEKQDMSVHLIDISSATFQVILNSLYTGCELLTKENVLDVWSAVHQLQIQFLIEHCEDFVIANLSLDLLEAYKQQAEYLQSKRICDYIFHFMCEHFQAFRKTKAMLELNFKDLMKIILTDQLKVSSEDEVLFAIFNWVKSGNFLIKNSNAIKAAIANESTDAFPNIVLDEVSTPNMEERNIHSNNSEIIAEEENFDQLLNHEEPNERKKFLIELITSSRYYLASESCLLRLYKDKLIQNDFLVKEILFEALNFKLSDNLHGHWPTPAIHRDCSDGEHVAVFSVLGIFGSHSLKTRKTFYTHTLPKRLNVQLTIFKRKLYACSIGSAPNEIYVLQKDNWDKMTEISHAVQLLLTHEKYIYMFDGPAKQITRFNPDISPIQFEMFANEIDNPAHALSFDNNIIVFSSVDSNGVEETAVHSWNTTTQVWTKLDNLNFSSKTMTSFRGDKDTFIMDCNCNLWKIKNTEIIEITFIDRISMRNYTTLTALLFRKTLWVYGDCSNDDDDDTKNKFREIDGVISSVFFVSAVPLPASNLIHYVIPTNELISIAT